MDNQEIQRMTSDELLKVIFHALNQKSAAALTLAIMLTDENRDPLPNDKQKELLLMLKAEIEAIRRINDMIHEWFSARRPN